METTEERLRALELRQGRIAALTESGLASQQELIKAALASTDAMAGQVAALTAVTTVLLARSGADAQRDALAAMQVAYEAYAGAQTKLRPEFSASFRALGEQWFPGTDWSEPADP